MPIEIPVVDFKRWEPFDLRLDDSNLGKHTQRDELVIWQGRQVL